MMKRSAPKQAMYLLAILFAALPFAFGVFRALHTGNDLRYLGMALATFIGASLVMQLGKVRGRSESGVLALSAAALVVATAFGAGLAILRATKLVPALVVASAFSFCWVVIYALDAFSRPSADILESTSKS